jgi:hypothetical protein
MTTATKATHRPKNGIIRGAKDIARLRRDCLDSMVGANQADRRFLKRSIAGLDRIISLHIELDTAVDSLRKLADSKPRHRVVHSARAGR